MLTLHYSEGEQPMADLLRLEGGQGASVIVEAVASGCKAALAGVRPGYALVTMNGRSEFTQLPGWQVRLLLEAPITLGFDPAPQKNQIGCTEIRLKRIQDTLGIPSRVAVCGPKDHGVLAEQVVFNPGQAPLFLRTGMDEDANGASPFTGPWHQASSSTAGSSLLTPLTISGDINADDLYCDEPSVQEQQRAVSSTTRPGKGNPAVYELRHREAQVLVGRAVHGARAVVGTGEEVECIIDSAGIEPRAFSPWRSPISYCSLDCVAECVNTEEDKRGRGFNRMGRAKQTTEPPRFTFHRDPRLGGKPPDKPKCLDVMDAATGSSEVPEVQNIWSGASNVEFLKRGETQKNAGHERCGGHCNQEDDDSWFNFHSSRSPLRWLAPVLEPVIRALSPAGSPCRTAHSPRVHSPRGSPSNSQPTAEALHQRSALSPFGAPATFPPARGSGRGGENALPIFHQGSRGSHSPRGARTGGAATAGHSASSTAIGPVFGGPPAVPRRNRSTSPQPRELGGDLTDHVLDEEELCSPAPGSRPAARPTGAKSHDSKSPAFSMSWESGPMDMDEGFEPIKAPTLSMGNMPSGAKAITRRNNGPQQWAQPLKGHNIPEMSTFRA